MCIRDRNNSSTGLGLYLCKKLCDKLSVDISIESEIGRGTKAVSYTHLDVYKRQSIRLLKTPAILWFSRTA